MSNSITSTSFRPLNEDIYTERRIDSPIGYSTEHGSLTYRKAAHELAEGVTDLPSGPEHLTWYELERATTTFRGFLLVLTGKPHLLTEHEWELFAMSVEGWIEDHDESSR